LKAQSATDVCWTLPLLAPRDLSAPLAWRSGRAISGAQFIGEALALAQQLPAAGRPINLCQDRYLFALRPGSSPAARPDQPAAAECAA
jgi:hypothetical protein